MLGKEEQQTFPIQFSAHTHKQQLLHINVLTNLYFSSPDTFKGVYKAFMVNVNLLNTNDNNFEMTKINYILIRKHRNSRIKFWNLESSAELIIQ